MVLGFFVLLTTIAVCAVPLVLFYRVVLEEHVEEWLYDRNRKQQLIYERNEVAAVLENIEKERPIATMTAVERADLLDLFAKEYPVWHAIYGEKMYMIPRSPQ